MIARKNDSNQILVAIMSAVMIISIIISVLFLVHETNHDCTGEDCPICAMMEIVSNNLESMGVGMAVVFAAVVFAAFVLHILASDANEPTFSLVGASVRLNI